MAFVSFYRKINAAITASLRLRRIDVNILLRVLGTTAVIASLMYVVNHSNIDIKTLGVKTGEVAGKSETVDRVEIDEEIKRTQEVLSARPDYAVAWTRLSVLYEQIGESEMSNSARKTAKNLILGL